MLMSSKPTRFVLRRTLRSRGVLCLGQHASWSSCTYTPLTTGLNVEGSDFKVGRCSPFNISRYSVLTCDSATKSSVCRCAQSVSRTRYCWISVIRDSMMSACRMSKYFLRCQNLLPFVAFDEVSKISYLTIVPWYWSGCHLRAYTLLQHRSPRLSKALTSFSPSTDDEV
jgi:hypothetical protein